ncbi:MAG: heme-binding protein [bacterium]|nr:heme-binding protein [bacterium]
MRQFLRIAYAANVLLFFGALEAMAVEEAQYTVLRKEADFEIRQYMPHVLAEIIVAADLEGAGNKAFRRLFGYISGDNRTRSKVAMTAPVAQQSVGEKIDMTAPVGQQRAGSGWAVSFMMPASYTMEALPEPDDPDVVLRQVPARRMAAVRYSGFWSEKSYHRHRTALESWIEAQGLVATGEPVWARYNAPFTPWFLRRNEILIPIDGGR